MWWLVPAAVALVVLVATRWHVLGRGVRLGWRFTSQMGLMGALMMLLAGWVSAAIAARFISGDSTIRDQVILLAGLWTGWALLVLFLLMFRAVRPAVADPGSHRRASLAGACCMGAVGLVLFWPLSHAAILIGAWTKHWITGGAPSPLAHELLGDLVQHGPGPWAWSLVLMTALVPAVLEEILYRGLLQESLRRSAFGRARGAWRCILLTSAIFVFMHLGSVDVHALPGLFVLSMGFGWVSARTGRLAASITMHMLFNVANLLLAVPWITGSLHCPP